MPSRPIDLHRLAAPDARSARRWYARRSHGAGLRFVGELRRAFEEIANDPTRWPKHLFGTRVLRLRKFPYLVVYFDSGTTIQIVAVAQRVAPSGLLASASEFTVRKGDGARLIEHIAPADGGSVNWCQFIS